jgi:hypothetical protein
LVEDAPLKFAPFQNGAELPTHGVEELVEPVLVIAAVPLLAWGHFTPN